MAVVLSRLVVLAVAAVLAAPPGWCCLARTGCCAGSAERKPAEPAKAAAEEKSGCCSCCHAAVPPGPSAEPGPCCHPGTPAKACCCERTPTNKPLPGPQVPIELPALATVTPVAHAPGSPGLAVALLTGRHAADPPLNVLHCVWTC